MYQSDTVNQHNIPIYVVCCICRNLSTSWGDQNDPKSACGGLNSILRTGPSSLFMSDFDNKSKGPGQYRVYSTWNKYIYCDFHLIALEIDFPYQCLMFKCIQLIIRSTCYWDLCRTHYSQKPSNSDDDYTV